MTGASLAILELMGPGQSAKTEYRVLPDELSRRESLIGKSGQ